MGDTKREKLERACKKIHKVRIRMVAVRMVCVRNMSVEETADILVRCLTWVCDRLCCYDEGGLEGSEIFRCGRARRVPRNIMNNIIANVAGCRITPVNLPQPIRAHACTSQPRTIEHGLISSRAMDRVPLLSLRLQQAIRMSLTLPVRDLLIMRQILSLLALRRTLSSFGNLTSLQTGTQENTIWVRNTCPDQNLSVRCKYPKNSGSK